MRLRLVSISILVFAGLACSRADAAGCIDPATLASATASITRLFDDNDADAPANLRGVRGTGWFLSPTSMVTIQHVTDEMKLSAHGWTPIDIRTEKNHSLIFRTGTSSSVFTASGRSDH